MEGVRAKGGKWKCKARKVIQEAGRAYEVNHKCHLGEIESDGYSSSSLKKGRQCEMMCSTFMAEAVE